MPNIDPRTREFIDSHRVARLATVDAAGQPTVVPICYAFDGERFLSAIDDKPKTVSEDRLKRLRNLRVNPRVSLVIDDYSEDWTELGYVLVRGLAEAIQPDGQHAGEHAKAVDLLRRKYPQYRTMRIDRRPIIRIEVTAIRRWSSRL
ncbi:MAG: TIGR03668 family PPOX class F420-dependent oxidoreductase [Vicinamibacteria bacterium]